MSRCQLCLFNVVAVGFVDNNTVRHFHNSAFDSLQFVSGATEGPLIMKVVLTLGAGFILVHKTAIIKRAEELKAEAAQN